METQAGQITLQESLHRGADTLLRGSLQRQGSGFDKALPENTAKPSINQDCAGLRVKRGFRSIADMARN